jgi:drug/metabolite transporter (DMT)-like permease
MNTSLILWAIAIASIFFGWPIVAKWSGLPATYAALVIYGMGTMVLTYITTLTAAQNSVEVKSHRLFGLAVIAVANCLCVYIYTKITSSKEVPAGIFMVTVSMFGVLFSLLFDYLLNSETLNKSQIFGGALAVAAIWFVSKK